LQTGYQRLAIKASDLARLLAEKLGEKGEIQATRDFVELFDGLKVRCILTMVVERE
jgi:hypothetical protein